MLYILITSCQNVHFVWHLIFFIFYMYLSIAWNTFKVFLTIVNTFYIYGIEKNIIYKFIYIKRILYKWKLFETFLKNYDINMNKVTKL